VSFAHPYLSLLEFGLKVTKKHREETIWPSHAKSGVNFAWRKHTHIDSVSYFQNQEPTLLSLLQSSLKVTKKHREETIWPSHEKSGVHSTSLEGNRRTSWSPQIIKINCNCSKFVLHLSNLVLSVAAENIGWMI
jgi:hypothetical protein